ncbi:MAG: hypothetical protein R3E76_00870 [Planctomycetota bacterium]
MAPRNDVRVLRSENVPLERDVVVRVSKLPALRDVSELREVALPRDTRDVGPASRLVLLARDGDIAVRDASLASLELLSEAREIVGTPLEVVRLGARYVVRVIDGAPRDERRLSELEEPEMRVLPGEELRELEPREMPELELRALEPREMPELELRELEPREMPELDPRELPEDEPREIPELEGRDVRLLEPELEPRTTLELEPRELPALRVLEPELPEILLELPLDLEDPPEIRPELPLEPAERELPLPRVTRWASIWLTGVANSTTANTAIK